MILLLYIILLLQQLKPTPALAAKEEQQDVKFLHEMAQKLNTYSITANILQQRRSHQCLEQAMARELIQTK